jgi:hypothetical protein
MVTRDLRIDDHGVSGWDASCWFSIDLDQTVVGTHRGLVDRFEQALREAAGVAEVVRYNDDWFALRTNRWRVRTSIDKLVHGVWQSVVTGPESAFIDIQRARARK